MKTNEIPTPAVIIMIDVMQKNINKMSETAKKFGVKLRPHIKSHKVSKIAHMQIEAGAVGITCAKVTEAEIMANSGIKDILIAYPLIQQYQINKAMELNCKAKMNIAFDSAFGAQMINNASSVRGLTTDIYMIIDTGLNRDGVAPGKEALEIALSIQELKNVKLKGIMTHEGQAYKAKNMEELILIGNDVSEKMVHTANLLRQNGIQIDEVSTGSTPTALWGITREGITEWRPGAYLFNDLSTCYFGVPIEECSLKILSTVVSHPTPNRYIIDAGSKILSNDSSNHEGFGFITKVPNALIERLSEEHGIVIEGSNSITLGQRIEIVPNHVCPVVNLVDKVYAVRGDDVVAEWNVDARGKFV